MKALHEPPYLTVGTDVSVKYRGAFCEAKIKTAKRLAKVKVTFRHDSSIVEVQDDHINGPLKVGAIVKVKNLDGAYQEAVINKLTDASWYTVGDYMLDTKPKEMPEIQRLNYEQTQILGLKKPWNHKN